MGEFYNFSINLKLLEIYKYLQKYTCMHSGCDHKSV
jgi:hypothetical protein